MKITKYVCDRCGKEIKDIHRVEIYPACDEDNALVDCDKDFCEDCAKKIAEFALNIGQEQEEKPTQDKKPESAESQKTIEVLLKEGKTTDEIVEIKGCTRTAVSTARWQMNKRKKKTAKEGEKTNGVENTKEEAKDEEKRLDIGKIFALWNANWNTHKIADEMGVENSVIVDILGL